VLDAVNRSTLTSHQTIATLDSAVRCGRILNILNIPSNQSPSNQSVQS
jgi:hypothetical protein